MKKTIIKGICFLGMLSGLLVLANAVYVRWFYQDDLVESDAMMLHWVDSLQSRADVIYFGESSNRTYSPHDTCPLAISEIIQRECPGIIVGTVDHGAYHAGLYLSLVRNIEPGSRVKTIIVTMNLRSFGQGWINSALETPLMKADVMYRRVPPIIKRLMLAFGDYDQKPWEERVQLIQKHWREDKLLVDPGFEYKNTYDWDHYRCLSPQDTFPDGTMNQARKDLACNYVKIMGFSIDTINNPRIKDFDEIVKVAKEKKLHLVFNLLPENMTYPDSLAGLQLTKLERANRDLLMKRYDRNGVIVVDNLELVNEKNFLEPQVITEHYDQYGRITIGKNVAAKAAAYLKAK